MSTAPALRSELASLARALADSPEDRLGRVMALIDALPDRGEADRVLDPARARLRRLRPRRRPNLTRLIFLPLDGAIVAPADWSPEGGATIPRSALTPLADLVRAARPGPAGEVAAGCAALREGDEAGVLALGAQIWPVAAATLALASQGTPPPGWAAAGLPAAAFPPVAALCALLIAQGPAIQRAVHAGPSGPEDALVHAALAPLAAAGAGPVLAAVSTLLRTAAEPGRVSAAAAALCPAAGAALEAELEDHIAAHLPESDAAPDEMASQARDLSRMLEEVGRATASRGAGWRGRLDRLRHAAQGTLRTGHEGAARTRVLVPAAALAGPGLDDPAMNALEEEALSLRRLETAARALGQDPAYDRTRRAMLERLHDLSRTAPRRGRMDLARLAELLGDPEAAARLVG